MNMKTLFALVLIIETICILSSIDATLNIQSEEKLLIRGRVTFPGGSRISIEPGAKLTVKLQDTSLADAPAVVIAQGTGTAKRFPMAFAIRYPSSQVNNQRSYSLSVTINDKNNQLLYINDVRVSVIPLGVNRTKFIDVPVIRVRPLETTTPLNKSQWPEVVGMKGTDAVKIIKQETNFTNVQIVEEGSPVTLDYRTDRVRVFVDRNGIVKNIPTIG